MRGHQAGELSQTVNDLVESTKGIREEDAENAKRSEKNRRNRYEGFVKYSIITAEETATNIIERPTVRLQAEAHDERQEGRVNRFRMNVIVYKNTNVAKVTEE